MSNLKIENFRAIKNADFEIADFLVVIGEQASGKSTVSKLIHYFKSLKKDAVDCIAEDSQEVTLRVKDKFNIKAQKRFYQLFGSTQNEFFTIDYQYAVGKSIKLSQEKGSQSTVQISISWLQEDWDLIVHDYLNLTAKFGQHSNGSLNIDDIIEVKRKREREKAEKEFSNKINTLFGDTDRRRNYIPASRSLISSLASSSGRRNAIEFFSKTNSDAANDNDVAKYFDGNVGEFFKEIDHIK